MKIIRYAFFYTLALITLAYLVPRSEFWISLGLFGLCFLFYYFIIKENQRQQHNFYNLLTLAIALRLSLLFALPELSDDYFRYFFDGQLLYNGINPYLSLPSEIFKEVEIIRSPYFSEIIRKMNSPYYYSIYPPLHQTFFYLSSLGGQNIEINILILRLSIIGFDIVNILLLRMIAKKLNVSDLKVWLYGFNPLVILELTANLHFEGILLTGLLISVYFYLCNKPGISALGWSWAVGMKLTPLILGPLLLLAWKHRGVHRFAIVSGIAILIFLFPILFPSVFSNFWQSFRLYQSTFEFNASIYYIVRWISGFFIDYNPIADVGPILSVLALVSISVFSLKWKFDQPIKFLEGIVWIYLIYLSFQNVVHPWYLIPAFGVSVLTKNKVLLIWTGLAFLSYSAYSKSDFKESAFLLTFEYSVLLLLVLTEIWPGLLSRLKTKYIFRAAISKEDSKENI